MKLLPELVETILSLDRDKIERDEELMRKRAKRRTELDKMRKLRKSEGRQERKKRNQNRATRRLLERVKEI